MKKTQVTVKRNGIKNSFKQAGASLLEALLWMAIALIVAGFATSLVKGAFSGSNTLKSGTETKALIAGTRSATGGSANYGTVSLNDALIAGGLVPSTLTTSGSTISNSFGGTVVVQGASNTFTVTETSIPQDVCVKKLTSADPGVLSITVNGGTAIALPVALATAGTSCNTAANTIVYTAS